MKYTLLLIALSVAARGQDAFEIQIYEYETVPKGMWSLETHINFTARGTQSPDGPVAPTNHQLHLTYELTHGITDNFEIAGYLVLAKRPGGPDPGEIAGWRVRPRFRLPKSWGLPVDISVSTEVGFPRRVYEENPTTFELRPILEKTLGKWQLDFNPTVTRALRGPGTSEGWAFEPGARVAYKLNKRFEPSLEYYGATGPVFDPLVAREQGHQFYPGGDIQITENLVWNFGLGFAATPAGNQLVAKFRIGWLFGKKRG